MDELLSVLRVFEIKLGLFIWNEILFSGQLINKDDFETITRYDNATAADHERILSDPQLRDKVKKRKFYEN